VTDPTKCSGCLICEYACSEIKEKSYNPKKSRIRLVRLGLTSQMAVACQLCEDAPCIIACPRDALKKSEATSVIMVDERKCNGCGWCVLACNFGSITIHDKKKTAVICDLCQGDPECIKACPEGALELTTEEGVAQRARTGSVKKILTDRVGGN